MIFQEHQQVRWAAFPGWEADPHLLHGFSTRQGGVSKGPLRSLNLGYSEHDAPENVRENRQRFYGALGIPPARVVLCRQVHSADVRWVQTPGAIDQCDGLLTDVPDLYLVIGVADCYTVFLATQDRRVVAVLHAGWRGTARRIFPRALHMIQQRSGYAPSQVEVGISPGIGGCCYEVGDEVADRFPHTVRELRNGSIYLDLASALVRQAEEAGIPADQIYQAHQCTSCHPEHWFSYRRDQGITGRMWGVIATRKGK